jgi:low affinity Fe/Cu permease
MEQWLKRHLLLLSAIGGSVGIIVFALAAALVIWGLVNNESLFPYIVKFPQVVQVILAIIFVALCIFGIVLVAKVYRIIKKSP